MADSALARVMISMLNSHFSTTVYRREDGIDIRLNIINMLNWNPKNFDSNKKLNISEVKFPTSNVVIKSKDGIKLATSIWLNKKPTNKWIIGIHGYNSSRFDVLYLTWHYRKLGYNILTFDFRNHGASDFNVVTWGYKEKWDLISVIEWLLKSYQVDEMGLVGTSMGGFTMNYLMLTEKELVKRANITWGIADSAYMSVPKMLNRMVSNNSLRLYAGYTKEILKDMLNIYKKDYGAPLEELDFVSMINPKEKHFPIFYLHNRWDRITDYLDSFRMHDIKNNMEETNNNKVKIFDGKHHTKALIEHTEEYKKITIDFVKKHQKQ